MGGKTVLSRMNGRTRTVWRGVWIFAGISTLLAGCVTDENMMVVQRDIVALRNDLAAQAKANESGKQLTDDRLRKVETDVRSRVESSVKESEGSRVALNQRLEELATETRFVQGKIEENASILQDLQARVDEADRRGRQNGQRVDGLDQQVKALGQQVRTLTQTSGAAPVPGQPGAAAPPAAVQPGPAQPPAAQPPPVPVAPPPPRPAPQTLLPPEEIYKAALSDYTKGEYDLAITGFRSYLKAYPKTSMAPNAQYWLGECYYGQKNYPQAIEEFDVVIQEYPDSPKVPSALFKQGDAYLQAGDTKQATTVLCELINKYGKTREARLARDKNIRCR